jgi:hypothetical protein
MSGKYRLEDLECSHCTSDYAQARQRRQTIAAEPLVNPVTPDDFIRQKTVLAWTHISRTYPAAASYILAKIGDPSLSYTAIARRFKVSKTTVQYQISLAIMNEPDLAGLLQIDHTRNRKHAHRK